MNRLDQYGSAIPRFSHDRDLGSPEFLTLITSSSESIPEFRANALCNGSLDEVVHAGLSD
jgi:hypothetical protein